MIRANLLLLLIAALAALDARGASTPQAPSVRQAPRSLEMAISRDEMVAPDGRLQARAIVALERMASMARDRGVELTVQVPADAIDAAPEIRRIAPASVIREVAARRPFKLVLRDETAAAHPPSRKVSRTGESSAYVSIHVRDETELDAAREHASQLRAMGAEVSETEIIVAQGPRRKQLRYFHPGDRAEAAALARRLDAGAEVQLLDLSREYGASVPPRHYELWLPPTASPLRVDR